MHRLHPTDNLENWKNVRTSKLYSIFKRHIKHNNKFMVNTLLRIKRFLAALNLFKTHDTDFSVMNKEELEKCAAVKSEDLLTGRHHL